VWARKCGEWEDTVASQKYTPGSSRARGTTKVYLFFYINRVKGLEYSITLCLGTHMTIYFEHLRRVLGIYD
jgi:hypothetical protein